MEKLPFDQACPKWGAMPNELCKNEDGLVIRGVHSERWPANKISRQDGFSGFGLI
jgi:hypothetical protein